MHIEPITQDRPHVAELLYVERQSLGDSDLSVDEALQTLRQPQHLCLGAFVGSNLAGFVSCFETYSPQGPRLEVDMLGVLPAHRNRGLATALVSAGTAHAHGAGTTAARSVVRTDNAASLAAFRKAGFTVVDETRMMIWDKDSAKRDNRAMPSTQSEQIDRQRVALGGKTHLWADRVRLLQGASCLAEALAVTVDTLAYRGCWVEELAGAEAVDRAALACAIGQAALAERRDEAGGLISLSDGDALAALKQAGWQAAGAYYVLSWSA